MRRTCGSRALDVSGVRSRQREAAAETCGGGAESGEIFACCAEDHALAWVGAPGCATACVKEDRQPKGPQAAVAEKSRARETLAEGA